MWYPVDESLLWMIHEDFQERVIREAQSMTDGARGTEERTLTSSENKTTFETHGEIGEYFHS